MSTKFDPIEDVIAGIAAGEIVIVVDDDDRENEGDLIMAASRATPEKVAFMIRHTSGIVYANPRGRRETSAPRSDGRA